MILRILPTGNLIVVDAATDFELSALKSVASAQYAPSYTDGRREEGETKCVLIEHPGNDALPAGTYLPAGLFNKLLALRSQNYNVNITGWEHLMDSSITDEKLMSQCISYQLPFSLHNHQFVSLKLQRTFKKSSIVVGTGGGKTLVCYLLSRTLLDDYGWSTNKVFVIVPTTQLVEQMHNDFADYAANVDKKLQVFKMYAGAKNAHKIDDCQVVCSTYQTATNKDASFFKQFNAAIVDEAHKTHTSSYIQCIQHLRHVEYKWGMTGSKPIEGSPDMLDIETYIGALLYEHPVHKMVTDGVLPEFEIIKVRIKHRHELTYDYFNYLITNNVFANKSTLVRAEQHHLFSTQYRSDILAKLAVSLGFNVLILSSRVPAVDNVYDSCVKAAQGTNIKVHKVHGRVKLHDRLDIIESCKQSISGNIIVANAACIGTGTSINTIVYAMFDGVGKSWYNTMQIVGRLLRKHPDKQKAVILDIADVLYSTLFEVPQSYSGNNYSVRHQRERIRIYKQNNYEIVDKAITLTL